MPNSLKARSDSASYERYCDNLRRNGIVHVSERVSIDGFQSLVKVLPEITGAVMQLLVQRAQRIDLTAPHFTRDTGRVGMMQHRISATAKLHSLILTRKEARAPEPRKQTLIRLAVAG